MSLRTAGIEKPIIIQIDGETHVCPTIHKIFAKGLGLPHTLRLNNGPGMNQGRAKGCISCFRHDFWQNVKLIMRVLGNILWIILGGLAIAIGWALVGLILCISIIGVPLGIQAFKMAGLTLTPFGKTVQYGGGVDSTLANILWVVMVGWWMALGYLGAGVLNCITIIGIPFGIQSFKMAKLALWPFGAQIYSL